MCIIKNVIIFIQIGPVAPLEDDKTSPEMANQIEQEVKRFTKVLYTCTVCFIRDDFNYNYKIIWYHMVELYNSNNYLCVIHRKHMIGQNTCYRPTQQNIGD